MCRCSFARDVGISIFSGSPPLTYSNIRDIVSRVPGRKRKGFYIFLDIPSLREKVKSDGDETKAHIDWYLQSHPHPSWRGIITALDGTEQTTIADSIRGWAEPIKGEPKNSHDTLQNSGNFF